MSARDFQVLTAVLLKSEVLWYVTLCRWVSNCRQSTLLRLRGAEDEGITILRNGGQDPTTHSITCRTVPNDTQYHKPDSTQRHAVSHAGQYPMTRSITCRTVPNDTVSHAGQYPTTRSITCRTVPNDTQYHMPDSTQRHSITCRTVPNDTQNHMPDSTQRHTVSHARRLNF
jgi:hypothetical protein